MKQAVHILHEFSDNFVVAILEKRDADEVLKHYESQYPELRDDLEMNADLLREIYGELPNTAAPSQREISEAYKKVSARLDANAAFDPHAEMMKVPVVEPRWHPSSMLNWLPIRRSKRPQSMKVRFSRPSLGMYLTGTVAFASILLAIFLVNPFQSHKDQQTAQRDSVAVQQDAKNTTSGASDYAASGSSSTDARTPLGAPDNFRGAKELDTMTVSQHRHRDSMDIQSLNKMTSHAELAAPSDLAISLQPGKVDMKWNAVNGALSYLIEMKEQDAPASEWHQAKVSPTNHVLLNDLKSGTSYQVRVIALNGNQKSPAGAEATFKAK